MKIIITLSLLFLASFSQTNEEFLELKKQVLELNKKVEELQKKEINTSQERYIDDDVSGSKPPKNIGTLELKNDKTVLSVGGRIELQSTWLWPEASFYAGTIPLKKNISGENGQLLMSARDSRLWVKTRTPTQSGAIRAIIETDFWGSDATETTSNSYGLRLRHAYVEFNGFTVGQTNSAFNHYVTQDTITYSVNTAFIRQPLVRYTIGSENLFYDISLEQPETTLLNPDADLITPKDDTLPDMILRFRYYPSWGELSSSVIARKISQDQADLNTSLTLPNSDSEYGYGVNFSTKIKVYELDDIRLNAQYGKGLGRYVAYSAFTAGSVDSDGKIKLNTSYGASLGYRHWWSDKLRSSFVGSFIKCEDIANTRNLDKITDDVKSLQVNLLYTPIKNLLVGVEYAKALRKVKSSDEGEMELALILFRYDF